MTVHTFYRTAVWLPLIVPLIVGAVIKGFSIEAFPTPVELLLYSGVYGGIPYAVLAGWATWWIGTRPEAEIRRRALRAPLWMIVLWTLLAAYVGIRAGRAEMFAGLVALGTVATLAFGYAYVGLVFLLRSAAGRAGLITSHGDSLSGLSTSANA